MNRPPRGLCAAGISLLAFGLLPSGNAAQMPPPKKAPVEQQTSSTTIWQARKNLTSAVQAADLLGVGVWCGTNGFTPPSQIEIDGETLAFYIDPQCGVWPRGVCNVDLRSLETTTVNRPLIEASSVRFDGKKRPTDSNVECLTYLRWQGAKRGQADAFAENIMYLRAIARGEGRAAHDAAWPAFRRSAAAWRALSPKPPISESVRSHFLLAEDAFQRKQLDSAIQQYEAGLEVDPMRPEGHFNAAFLYGELKYWEQAAWHMRCYLELLPDAPDARQVRDQLLVWQAKLAQAAPAAEAQAPTRRK